MQCEHSKLSFITMAKTIGTCINREHSVHICVDCGRFRIFSRVNNESQTFEFVMIDESQLESALKFVNKCRKAESEKPLGLVEI